MPQTMPDIVSALRTLLRISARHASWKIRVSILSTRLIPQCFDRVDRRGTPRGIDRRQHRYRPKQEECQHARLPRGNQTSKEVGHGEHVYQRTEAKAERES